VIDIPVPVVLASSSPTRRTLLSRVVRDFDVVGPGLEEEAGGCPKGGAEAARRAVVGLARAKARRVAAGRPAALVIGADTLVVCGEDVLGKPGDEEEAVRMLRRLTRTPHRVLTGLCLLAPDERERSTCVEAAVRMRPMSEDEIRRYVAAGEALGKAGAYALQPDDPNVDHVEGSATAVMGLPLDELEAMLRELYLPGQER
jgi:septum formation protein